MAETGRGGILGIRGRVEKTLERIPGGAIVRDRFNDVEDQVMRNLKERLERVEMPALPGPPRRLRGDGKSHLAWLLKQALNQSVNEAREALYESLLDQLVPDEARIIGALSDGSHHALIHVGVGPPVGPVVRVMISNVSNLPKAADVTLLEHSRYYISHLRDLEILETGPEDPSLAVKYQVLQGDSDVRRRMKEVEKETKMPVRYLHRVVRLSPLGMDLWKCYAPH